MSVFVADISTTRLSRAINMISFRASDVVLVRATWSLSWMKFFNALVQRMFELLGQRPGSNRPAACAGTFRAAIGQGPDRRLIGALYLLSPAYQQWCDEIEQSAEDE